MDGMDSNIPVCQAETSYELVYIIEWDAILGSLYEGFKLIWLYRSFADKYSGRPKSPQWCYCTQQSSDLLGTKKPNFPIFWSNMGIVLQPALAPVHVEKDSMVFDPPLCMWHDWRQKRANEAQKGGEGGPPRCNKAG